jgi:predicted nucleotidyltransferase component of viral defense system
MIERTLENRIREYGPASELEQENILTETLQLYILASLAKADFFNAAEFQGGTCLRLIHGMERFSEDLDFVLRQPDSAFDWARYLAAVHEDCAIEGIKFEVLDKTEAGANVRKAFLKTESIGRLLELKLPFSRHPERKIRIRLEIDANPPAGSVCETHYINFPLVAVLTVQNLPSGFAGKCHALLCRPYIKGRDWYDFAWYVARKTRVNFNLLGNALAQIGPWAGQNVKVDEFWLMARLEEKIHSIDWSTAREDVRRFIPLRGQAALDLWNGDFFIYQTGRMREYLQAQH